MCGIYLTNIPYDGKEINQKLDFMNYRGPENRGVLRADKLIFGHLRLKILDLDKRSNQPMHFKNLTIIFNGEIYNYKDLKKELSSIGYKFKTTSDTEVILKSFFEWGPKFVNKLNGMFAMCIYDKNTKKIYCYRDRLGQKPFYYYWNNGIFEICSQLRPLAKNKTLSEKAISIYLDCGYIPSPLSIFNEVKKLDAGHVLIIDLINNSISNETYWTLVNSVKSDLSYKEAKDKLHDLLIDSVKIRLNSDVPAGTFLSGGVDSALITSLAQKSQQEKLIHLQLGLMKKSLTRVKLPISFLKLYQPNTIILSVR